MSKYSKHKEIPTYHREHTFYCDIPDLQTFIDIVNGGRSIPDRCSKVQLPIDIFNKLALSGNSNGMIVNLPCNIDDTVYWFWNDLLGTPDKDVMIESETIHHFYIDKDGVQIATDVHDGVIGKLGNNGPNARQIFLSQEEAESALKGNEDGTNEDKIP